MGNSQVRCSNGFMHTSSCFTVCDAGHKFTSIYASNKGRRYPAQLRNICFCRNSQCKWYGNTGLQCTAENVEKPEWGEWSEWSTCSATCGRGQRFQVRACSEEGIARELQQKLNRVKLSLASVRAPVPPTVGVEIAHKTASSRGGAAVTSTSLKFACKPVVVVQRKLPALVLNQEKVR